MKSYRRYRRRSFRRPYRRSSRRSSRRNRYNKAPRDVNGYSRSMKTAKISDTYNVKLTTVFTADQFWNTDPATPNYSRRQLLSNLLTNCRGYADLAARFNTIKINSAHLACNLGNIAAGNTSNVMVGYFPSSQLEYPLVVQEFFETPGCQVKMLNPNNPRCSFKLAGAFLGEHYATAALSGYVMSDAHSVYFATGATNRTPEISYGVLGCYFPANNIQANPGNMLIRVTFNVSFASPIIVR